MAAAAPPHTVPLVPVPPTASLKTSAPHAKSNIMLKTLMVSGVSVATASLCTNPIDVVKTRLQLQGTSRMAPAAAGEAPLQRLGMSQLMVQIVRQEGFMALWKGIGPSIVRGLTYGGLRLGMYEPIKDSIQTSLTASGHPPSSLGSGSLLAIKVVAGCVAGGGAAAVTTPMELIKTRLQAVSDGQRSAMQVIRQVVAQDGYQGLFRGAVPGIVRAMMLNAGQCATYDVTKREIMLRTGWSDHVGTQVACALVTGLVTTTVSNPPDVVKTVMFVGGGADRKQGPWAAAKALVWAEGPSVLMRGWLANYMRLGPQTLVTFLVAERLRRLVGLDGL